MLGGAVRPLAQRGAVVGAVRIEEDFEAPAVMALQHPGKQHHRRMVVKVARHIADAQTAPVQGRHGEGRQRLHTARGVARRRARRAQLQRRVVPQREGGKGQCGAVGVVGQLPQRGVEGLDVALGVVPEADLALAIRQGRAQVQVVLAAAQRQRGAKALHGLFLQVEPVKAEAQVRVRRRVVDLAAQRGEVGVDGLAQPAGVLQGAAELEVVLGAGHLPGGHALQPVDQRCGLAQLAQAFGA